MKKKFIFTSAICLFLFMLLCVSSYAEEERTISTKEDLVEFANEVNSGNDFSGVTVLLANDIDLQCSKDNQWVPIGKAGHNLGGNHLLEDEDRCAFRGNFDGKGHTISGIYIDSNIYLTGLFGLNEGVIENLTIKDSTIKSEGSYVGGIAGFCSGDVINCNNYVDIEATTDAGAAGGIVGYATNDVLIENCVNYGDIVNNVGAGCGGITGYAFYARIQKCLNLGNIDSYYCSGGIAGRADSCGIFECANKGNTRANMFSGGICGVLPVDCNIRYCYNTGTISLVEDDSQVEVGGIGGLFGFAKFTEDSSILQSCYDIGDLADYPTNSIGSVNIPEGSDINKYIENVYYKKGKELWAPEKEVIKERTAQEFKSSNMLQELNSTVNQEMVEEIPELFNSEGKIFVSDTNSINGGYPILFWEHIKNPNAQYIDEEESNVEEQNGDEDNNTENSNVENSNTEVENQNSDLKNDNGDDTKSKTKIPQAGTTKWMFIAVSIVFALGITSYVKLKRS